MAIVASGNFCLNVVEHGPAICLQKVPSTMIILCNKVINDLAVSVFIGRRRVGAFWIRLRLKVC